MAGAEDLPIIFDRGDTPYDLEPWVGLLSVDEQNFFEVMVRKLGRISTPVHIDLFLYVPRCAVCLRTADVVRRTRDPTYTSLLHCPDCRAAFACSEVHRAKYLDEHCRRLEDGESFTECEMNKRVYEHSFEIATRGWTPSETLWFPMRRKGEYTPLPSSWDQWFADPSNLCPPDSSPALNRVRTWQLSIPMTILYGMQLFDDAAGDLPLLSSRTELEIAIIGANDYELKFGGLGCFEELLHNLPTVRRLTVRFIGPEISKEVLEWVPCALCKEKGIELVHSIHLARFHDYVKERTAQAGEDDGPTFQWPDMAVMFNTGMGLNVGMKSGWSPTLEGLAKNGVPTVCTSFLKRESKEDKAYLNMHHCTIIFDRHKNPWRSEAVMKMLHTTKGYFSYNMFVQGFRGWHGVEESTELVRAGSSRSPIIDEPMRALTASLFEFGSLGKR